MVEPVTQFEDKSNRGRSGFPLLRSNEGFAASSGNLGSRTPLTRPLYLPLRIARVRVYHSRTTMVTGVFYVEKPPTVEDASVNEDAKFIGKRN